MPRTSAGRRYAEAAFEIAGRDGTIDEWQRDLREAAQLAGDERVTSTVDSPAAPFAERRRVVEQLLGSRVSRPALNLTLLLAERQRFGIVPQISARFDELVRRSRQIAAASLTTAAPLSQDELAAVTRRIEELAGERVELTTNVDPSLIGGLTVRIGDRLIDASVRGRLERLRERLTQGAIQP